MLYHTKAMESIPQQAQPTRDDQPFFTRSFGGWEQFHKDTFSPFCEWDIVALKVKGKTYQERKNDLINTAIHYQYLERSGLSWGELATIGNWFETQAKRYGLINEFRENAII